MGKYKQGFFKPRNPSKYEGDPTNIVYRSSWELHYMMYLDDHRDVISWRSEETIIPYRSPLDNKIHRYFVDFKVTVKTTAGKIETYLIEIKPKSQMIPPKIPKTGLKSKRYVKEVCTYAVNQKKWEAAEEYCKDHGWKFMKLNEDDLGIVYK